MFGVASCRVAVSSMDDLALWLLFFYSLVNIFEIMIAEGCFACYSCGGLKTLMELMVIYGMTYTSSFASWSDYRTGVALMKLKLSFLSIDEFSMLLVLLYSLLRLMICSIFWRLSVGLIEFVVCSSASSVSNCEAGRIFLDFISSLFLMELSRDSCLADL